MIGLLGTLALLAFIGSSDAIGQTSCVSFQESSSVFSVFSNGAAAPVYLSDDEWPGVQRAASDFASDVQMVTGSTPQLKNITSSENCTETPIIVGTLGKSSLIDQIVNNTHLDVSSIDGQWEAYMGQEISNPLPGISKAYVIIGADKRGSIFALYDLSEQFGVSPWYWWADVPTTKQSSLFISSAGCSHGTPTVKYRGIFFNDEQPALQNWAMVKYTNGTGAALTGSPFNHYFYTQVFELILRLRGNFLWPAMWSSAFGIDDSENQFLADWYGIAMGTSHEEPMMRSTPVEWTLFGVGPWDYSVNRQNIYNYWVNGTERSKNYESVYTIGMRGDGDLPLAGSDPIATLEEAISDQRGILTNVFPGTNITTIPQVWCLYKEVEGYYDEGMTAPDDVTLLWTDDNYGNIRRFPIYSERSRAGGAGVYYHYDYVGDPMDYKWITSTQLSKVYEQMSLAVDRDATRLWILNVGDLKPYEMSTEFFITYGYDAPRWNYTNIDSFVSLWAQREFDFSVQEADVVAEVIANLTRLNANRKPELVNATTYSFSNYREAENVLAMWNSLNQTATGIYNGLSADKQAAFFELVLHPVQASATLGILWLAAGMNNVRGQQAFLSTNNYAEQAEALFERDYDLELEYHTILDGKWDHMMDQTHVLYWYWQGKPQPTTNILPPITWVSTRKQNIAGVMRIVPEGTLGAWPGDNQNQCAQGYSCPPDAMVFDPYVPYQNRYIDVGIAGPVPFTFTVTSNVSWLSITPASGSLTPNPDNVEQRVFFSVPDWSQINGAETAEIMFNATAADQPELTVTVTFTANHTVAPPNFTGFVEGDGVVSIEAAHTSRNTSLDGITWTEIPNLGRTLSGVTPWPRMANNGTNYTAGTGPNMEYDFYNFGTVGGNGSVGVTTYVSPSLNANGLDRPLALAIQVDSETPQTVYFMPAAAPGEQPAAWDGLSGFAATNIVPVSTNFTAAPGAHTLTVWMVEPAVVVQKIVIDCGGLLPSYLGPPESMAV